MQTSLLAPHHEVLHCPHDLALQDTLQILVHPYLLPLDRVHYPVLYRQQPEQKQHLLVLIALVDPLLLDCVHYCALYPFVHLVPRLPLLYRKLAN